MSLPMDLAYSSGKWAYAYHRPGRVAKQVIRITKHEDSETKSSKSAVNNIDTVFKDDTGAGKEWSEEELQTDMLLYKSELAVVVGEILQKPTTFRANQVPKQLVQFNREEHLVVPNQDTRIIVLKLDDRRADLYALYKKQNGLCDTLQLPQKQENRIVFYPEWVALQKVTEAKANFNLWKDQVTSFIKQYIIGHEFLDVVSSSSNPKAAKTSAIFNAWDSYDSRILLALSLYKNTRNVGHLMQARSLAQEALKQPVRHHSQSNEERIIDILISGREQFTMEESREAAKACKSLFSVDDPEALSEIFQPVYLLALGRGLRSMAAVHLPVKYYGAFVTHFCCSAADKGLGEIDSKTSCLLIKESRTRALITIGDDFPAPRIPINLASAGAEMLAMVNCDILECTSIIEAIKGIQAAEWNAIGGKFVDESIKEAGDLRFAIENCAQAWEFNEAKDKIEDLVRILYLKFDKRIEEILNIIELKRERSTRIRDSMVAGGIVEDDEEEDDEEDDEE